jgi:hypothetical protein
VDKPSYNDMMQDEAAAYGYSVIGWAKVRRRLKRAIRQVVGDGMCAIDPQAPYAALVTLAKALGVTLPDDIGGQNG